MFSAREMLTSKRLLLNAVTIFSGGKPDTHQLRAASPALSIKECDICFYLKVSVLLKIAWVHMNVAPRSTMNANGGTEN